MGDSNATPMSAKQEAFLLRLFYETKGADGAEGLTEFKARCGGAPTTVQASAEITRLQSRPGKVPARAAKSDVNVPEGRYGIYGDDGVLLLVQVGKPTEGKWAGRTFLTTAPLHKTLQPTPIMGDAGRDALNKIQTNPFNAAAVFGRTTGRCPACRRRLQEGSSGAEVGIHPECMSVFVLPSVGSQ